MAAQGRRAANARESRGHDDVRGLREGGRPAWGAPRPGNPGAEIRSRTCSTPSAAVDRQAMTTLHYHRIVKANTGESGAGAEYDMSKNASAAGAAFDAPLTHALWPRPCPSRPASSRPACQRRRRSRPTSGAWLHEIKQLPLFGMREGPGYWSKTEAIAVNRLPTPVKIRASPRFSSVGCMTTEFVEDRAIEERDR
jgi:hypothetical protein